MKVGYARESTDLKSQDQALEYQQERLKRYGCAHIFTDRASGASTKRKAYNEMMGLVRSGAVSEVVVCSVSRLGRSLAGIQAAIELLLTKGVKFTTLDGSIDLTTPAGRANMQMQGVWAELERELIRERISIGWEGVRSKQKAVNPPFAYLEAEGRYQLDVESLASGYSRAEVAHEIIATFVELRTLRGTVQKICLKYPELIGTQGKRKGIPRSSTGLKDWLLNPVLQGHTCYKKRNNPILIRNTHPDQRLLTDEDVQQIREILSFNRFHHGFKTDAPKFPLTGLIKCGWCGGSTELIGVATRSTNVRYYQCQKYPIGQCAIQPVKRGEVKPVRTSIRTDVVEMAVIQALVKRERSEAIADLAGQPTETTEPAELLEIRNRLAALERIPGSDPYIEQAKRGIETEIQNWESKLQIESDFVDTEMKRKLLEAAQRPEFWASLDLQKKGEYFRALIKRIVIRGDQIEKIELWI